MQHSLLEVLGRGAVGLVALARGVWFRLAEAGARRAEEQRRDCILDDPAW
ncbi:MAG: hypothetical protein H0T50_14100 [Gemmatimonadales bacterium]|nr:hypothetical protein [Gemmatimonadales bacterium]